MHFGLKLSTSALAMACVGGVAHAADHGAQSTETAQGSVAAAPASQNVPPNSVGGQAGASSSQPAEIVVTALRTGQNIQKTPAAVTAISGDALAQQRIVTLQGVQNLSPAARFSQNEVSTRIFIRGVGSAIDNYYVPETTAVNLNGTYLPRFATVGGLYDVSSIQILPGPQGVLYGRSAGGGAIVINTNRPVNTAGAAGTFQYGNYNTVHFDGMANLPVTDTLAVRGAVYFNRNDGYGSFNTYVDNSASFRLSALWRPTTEFSLFVWGSYFKQDGKPPVVQYIPFVDPSHPWAIPKIDPVTGLDNTAGAFENFKYGIGGYEAKYDAGFATIENTGSVLRQTDTALRKLVGNNQTTDNAQTQFTEALHIFGKSGGLSWIAGVDWLHAKSRQTILFGIHQLGNIFPIVRTDSISGFAQGTYSVSDSFRVVAGVRYSHDTLYLHGTGSACFGPCVYNPIDFDKGWSHADLKGGVEYDLTPKILAYANVQTGYAPGTLNTYANSTLFNKEVQPQTLLAYTAGVKSTTDDGKFDLNLEGYYYTYKNLIITAFNTSIGQASLYNAPHAYIGGAQLMAKFRPTSNDTLSANVAWTHGIYGNYQPNAVTRNLDGLQLVFTPTWTATLSYEHRFELAGGARVDARVASYLSSSYWGTFDHSAQAQQGSYSKTDASLTYHAASGIWSAGAWVANIENTAVKTALVASGYGPGTTTPNTPYVGSTLLEPPRTYGLTLGFKF